MLTSHGLQEAAGGGIGVHPGRPAGSYRAPAAAARMGDPPYGFANSYLVKLNMAGARVTMSRSALRTCRCVSLALFSLA